MGGGDESDRVGAAIEYTFDLSHDLRKRNLLLFDLTFSPTDLKVLAVNALHIAPGEEYIADAVGPGNDRFFASMRADRSDREPGTALTESQFTPEPVGVAIPWTAGAVAELFQWGKDRLHIKWRSGLRMK
jgi:hypothetical protein